MPKPKLEPLKGAVRTTTPPARLLGDEDVEALIAQNTESEDDEGEDT